MARARSSDGVEIHYETWGRGAPLLLIPGLGADLRIWACQRLVLGLRRRCIALDNRGAGHSGTPEGPYTIAQMADDARAVLDAAGVERSDILAYSMGSYAAQALAADHPERVGSMVLAGTACRHHDWRRDLLTGWARLATERGMHVMARAAFPWLLGPRTARRHGLWINALWPLVLSQPAPAFCAQVEALLATDDSDEARSRLSEITAPTLVLAGEQDHLMPPSDGAETAALIPGAAFTVVPGAGHGLMLEAPADFNGAVLNFLAAQTVGTAPT